MFKLFRFIKATKEDVMWDFKHYLLPHFEWFGYNIDNSIKNPIEWQKKLVWRFKPKQFIRILYTYWITDLIYSLR